MNVDRFLIKEAQHLMEYLLESLFSHLRVMPTLDLFTFINQYTPIIQEKALRLSNDNMAIARQIYQRTTLKAMNIPAHEVTFDMYELKIDDLMIEVYQELLFELSFKTNSNSVQ